MAQTGSDPRSAGLGDADALIVVDVQVDFCPGGALAVPGGNEVVPVLNAWIRAAGAAGARVYASRDWHPREHPSFDSRGGPWPPHCIQDTPGAAFRGDLTLPEDAIRISKGTRLDRDQLSAFDETGLAHHLRTRGVRRLWIGGLAQDVCVRATVLDALREGFETHLLLDATRPVQEQAGTEALDAMREAGVRVEGGP